MFSDITETFLNSIRALRFYVNSVESNIENPFIDYNINNENEIFARLIYLIIYAKKKDSDILTYIKNIEGMTENDINIFTEIITKMESLIKEKEIDGKKVYKYEYLPKEIKEEYQKFEIGDKQEEILYSGSLMLLVTYFENLLAGILKKDFIRHPERASLGEKSVSYKLLSKIENIQDIRDILIEQEVTNIMYGNLSDWKRFFQKSMKLDVALWEEKFDVIEEIFSRRNLFVHNNGVINNTYLNKTNSHNKKKIGEYVGISREYIDKALDIIEFLGISLIIEIWMKEFADDENETKTIINIIYDEYLETERWEMAKYFYQICLHSKKICTADRILCQINYWQCCKWEGEYDKVKNEIENLDISAYKPMYILGVLSLKEDYEKFFEIFDKQDDVGEIELREWPLFRELRNSEEYLKRFPEIESKFKEY